jgi:uncharacterized protein (DUF486 family)
LRGIYTILLLVLSNIFMTLAWYGHLQVKKISWMQGAGLLSLILVSWGLAFFEYIFQVPANRIGFNDNGGPFNLFQLKIIQEVISITVFTVFAVYIFKTDKLSLNYIIGFVFMILAVYFIFKK